MKYIDPSQLITLDAVQDCFEQAVDTTGCRNCPRFIPLEQQLNLGLIESRFGGDAGNHEVEEAQEMKED